MYVLMSEIKYRREDKEMYGRCVWMGGVKGGGSVEHIYGMSVIYALVCLQ